MIFKQDPWIVDTFKIIRLQTLFLAHDLEVWVNCPPITLCCEFLPFWHKLKFGWDNRMLQHSFREAVIHWLLLFSFWNVVYSFVNPSLILSQCTLFKLLLLSFNKRAKLNLTSTDYFTTTSLTFGLKFLSCNDLLAFNWLLMMMPEIKFFFWPSTQFLS